MQCPFFINQTSQTTVSYSRQNGHAVIKSGSFIRASDGIQVQRYFCKRCLRKFSGETLSPLKYQKKRHLNDAVFSLFASGVSQRRMAKILNINKKTVVRKFLVLGKISLNDISRNKHIPIKEISEFIFDEMETFEHTKLKPLSIALAVEKDTRLILDFKVSSMKAKGLLAQKAVKKYGVRKDDRKKNLKELLERIKTRTSEKVIIKSDMNPHYPALVKNTFPNNLHITFKGKRGCVVGQGELKATKFDPIFSFNHTAAMLRANINRLFRRTWNTTKKLECLEYHIAIYIFYHNLRLLNQSLSNDS